MVNRGLSQGIFRSFILVATLFKWDFGATMVLFNGRIFGVTQLYPYNYFLDAPDGG